MEKEFLKNILEIERNESENIVLFSDDQQNLSFMAFMESALFIKQLFKEKELETKLIPGFSKPILCVRNILISDIVKVFQCSKLEFNIHFIRIPFWALK